MDSSPLIEKYAGTIVSILMAGLTGVTTWAARLSARINLVEDKASANAADIRHIQSDLTELKDTVRSNHRETMHGLERVHDKLDAHWGRE